MGLLQQITELNDNVEDLLKKLKTLSYNLSEIEYKKYVKSINYIKSEIHSVENNKLIEAISSSIDNINEEVIDINRSLEYYKNSKDDLEYRLDYVFENLRNEAIRINYLKILGKDNLVLIGPNGSGKSSLASFMKESFSENIIVIPAQKVLFYNKNYSEALTIERAGVWEVLITNFNKKKIYDDPYNNELNSLLEGLSRMFTYLISLTVNEFTKISSDIMNTISTENVIDKETKELIVESNFKRLEKLWNKLIPGVQLEPDSTKRMIIPVRNGIKYNINDLSDGEKVILFYILIVLYAKDNSYIIIDEPETFLNPSNYNRLWNLLETIRKDCTFIYISHNPGFVSARYDHTLYWCKSYNGNYEWDINEVDKKLEELPKSLITELVGARKPILFCEGLKDSLDYKVYSVLFENEAIVIPVEGHVNVINYTKLYNALENTNNKAFGIMDRDQYSAAKLEEYKKDGIYCLVFNEIEMFLLSEEILENVLSFNYGVDSEMKEQTFKSKFFEINRYRKESILKKYKKSILDEFLMKERIDEKSSIIDIKNNIVNRIESLDLESKIKNLDKQITEVLENEKYFDMLKLCPFKDMLEEAKKIFGLDYKSISINRLGIDQELRAKVREKYFNNLTEEIFKSISE